jgi:phage-related protein
MPDKGRRKQPSRGQKSPGGAGAREPGEGSSAPTGCSGWQWARASRGKDARSRVQDDYYKERRIPKAVRAEFDQMRRRYRDGGLRNGANIKAIGDGIYEFKYSHIGNTPYRLLFMRWGPWAVALDVFKKTTDVTPKERALERKKAWMRTFGDKPA